MPKGAVRKPRCSAFQTVMIGRRPASIFSAHWGVGDVVALRAHLQVHPVRNCGPVASAAHFCQKRCGTNVSVVARQDGATYDLADVAAAGALGPASSRLGFWPVPQQTRVRL